MKRSIVTVAIVAALVLASIPAMAQKKPVTITAIHNSALGAEGIYGWDAQLIEKFKAAHPEIKWDQEVVGHDAYETKIKTLAAADQLPDVFLIKGSWVLDFVKAGLVGSVDEMLAMDNTWKKGFSPGVFYPFQAGGKTYGIPSEGAGPTSIVFWNKKVFADAGIKEFPKTWDGFMSTVAKLKAKGYTPIALGNKGKWVAESCIESALGDRYTGTEWFSRLRMRQGAKFTDPEFVKSLAALQSLAKAGAFNEDMNSIDYHEMRALYYTGKVGMLVEGLWAISRMDQACPKDVYENTVMTVLPSVPGGKGIQSNATSGGAGWGWAVSSKVTPEKKKVIMELFKSLSDADYGRKTLENSRIPASMPATYDTSKFSPMFTSYLKMHPTLTMTPIYDILIDSASTVEVMNSGLQELLIGSVSPEELAKRIQADWESSASK